MLDQPALVAKLASEFVGTFFLCFTVGNGILGSSSLAALAIASSLMVAVYSLGSVSGAHFNPAVTLGLYISGKLQGPGDAFPGLETIQYIFVQLLSGGISGWLAIWLWSTDLGGDTSPEDSGMLARAYGKLGSPDHFGNVGILGGELLYTFMLVFVVLNVATCGDIKEKNNYFGLAIGFVIAAGASAEGNISGTCLNPAVTFAVAVTNPVRNMAYLPVYWGGQILGTLVAVATFYACRAHIFHSKHDIPALWSKLVAEFIGTFMLVITVCLVVVQDAQAPVTSIIGIASSLMCMIYALWNVSGANFNPAVSFALLLTNNLPAKEFGLYVLAQLFGGFSAVGIATSFYPDWHVGLGVGSKSTAVHLAHGSVAAIVVAEIFYTALLVFAVLNSAVRDAGNQYFGLIIGFSVVVGGVSVGSLSGGAFNPAVALSLFFGGVFHVKHFNVQSAFLYPVSELIGAAVAAGIFKVISLKTGWTQVATSEIPLTKAGHA